ncbi:DUF4043 family protein [Comamonas thiooxydans]|uniref:phage capsid family protein n=1 Tax=Comamonas thiooxydans TaxID=363952 RepID=UPI001E6027BE|nr:DUF4043 family protein [Comamonas thiooxydans]
MSGKTNVGAGSSNAQFVQAAGLFAQSMQRNSKLNKMVGTMPKGEGEAAATLRNQTTTDMPIVRVTDLGRGKGDEVEFHFIQPAGAYPIMGSRMAEGSRALLRHYCASRRWLTQAQHLCLVLVLLTLDS